MVEIREDRDEAPEGQEGQGPKLVDVRESIRYRRRAQEAEQRAAVVESQLEELRMAQDGREKSLEEVLSTERRGREELERRLESLEIERRLERELIRAGAIDPETALLVARERLASAGSDEVDVAELARQVLQEKPHLRAPERQEVESLGRASQGVRPRNSEPSRVRRLAEAARSTGRRSDLVEYMRARRQKKTK
jgi:hypothetical protein